MRIILFASTLILFGSCSKHNFNLNEEFEIKYEKSAFVAIPGQNQLNIKFLDLYEESRCAPGHECFWAGRVAVVLKMNDLSLDTLGLDHSQYLNFTQIGENTVTLLEVNYASDKDFGKKNKSSIKLKVE